MLCVEKNCLSRVKNIKPGIISDLEFLSGHTCLSSMNGELKLGDKMENSIVISDEVVLNICCKWKEWDVNVDQFLVFIELMVNGQIMLDGNYHLLKPSLEIENNRKEMITYIKKLKGNWFYKSDHIAFPSYEAYKDMDEETERMTNLKSIELSLALQDEITDIIIASANKQKVMKLNR